MEAEEGCYLHGMLSEQILRGSPQCGGWEKSAGEGKLLEASQVGVVGNSDPNPS